jgi:hypothetical protein
MDLSDWDRFRIYRLLEKRKGAFQPPFCVLDPVLFGSWDNVVQKFEGASKRIT